MAEKKDNLLCGCMGYAPIAVYEVPLPSVRFLYAVWASPGLAREGSGCGADGPSAHPACATLVCRRCVILCPGRLD